MKETRDKYGPDVPNYQLLNEAARQQKPAAKKPRKGKSGNKGQSQPDATKPD